MPNSPTRASLHFLCFLLLVVLAFVFFYSTPLAPIGEFGSYIRVQRWDSVYGVFFRPLPINLLPAWMDRLFGANFARYAFFFGIVYAMGLAVTTCLLRVILLWTSAEDHSLLRLGLLITFGFSNVYLVSALLVQYTATDFIFMTTYAAFLMSVVLILNSGQICVRHSLLAGGSLALMCASKEFVLFVPGVLVLLLALRFREARALAGRQPVRTVALLLLLGLIAGIYLALLLTRPTFVAASLAGSPPLEGDFARAEPAKFISNLRTSMIWLSQTPVTGNYPYVFNPLPMLGPVSHVLSWAYVTILIVGSAAALLTRNYRRVALFHLGSLTLWCLIASGNSRVLSSYLAPAFLHLALLWSLGALVALKWLRSAWTSRLVNISCVGLLLWSMWLGSATLYSPQREVSFHGAMAALDSQYRSILRVLLMTYERFVVTFEYAGAPDYALFHLAHSGTLSAGTEVTLEGFRLENSERTMVLTGRRIGAPVGGEAAHVRVQIATDPLLGSRFRIVEVEMRH